MRSFERRTVAKIEKYIRLGDKDGAMEDMASHRLAAIPERERPSGLVIPDVSEARRFWFASQQRNAGRRLHEDMDGIIAFDLSTAGSQGSKAVIELPDHEDPAKRTTRYLDTSHRRFRDIAEEEFCVGAVSYASYYYLSLAKEVAQSSEVVAGMPASSAAAAAEAVQPEPSRHGLVLPIPNVAVQPV